jgi:alpha-L-rhamnosidase
MWTGVLRQAVILERNLGEAARAAEYQGKADKARADIRKHCWDTKRGLFADEGDHKVFSQHMNVFAVLYDIATPEEAPGILERVTTRGGGIDAPPGMYSTTYYFAWYLARAFEHAGQSGKYHDLLKSWRDLLPLNYTTWPETREQPRSDTHAWSAHPTADLLRFVAGIRAAAPGYARVSIAPELGGLTSLDASAVTPRGLVKVSYRVAGEKLTATIERPSSLPGEFVWQGKIYPLEQARTNLELRN